MTSDRTLIGVEPKEYARLKARAEQADELRAALSAALWWLEDTQEQIKSDWRTHHDRIIEQARAALAKETP